MKFIKRRLFPNQVDNWRMQERLDRAGKWLMHLHTAPVAWNGESAAVKLAGAILGEG